MLLRSIFYPYPGEIDWRAKLVYALCEYIRQEIAMPRAAVEEVKE